MVEWTRCRTSSPDWAHYRERLWPAAWVFLATALVIPASLLVFLPISTTAGIVVRDRAVRRDRRSPLLVDDAHRRGDDAIRSRRPRAHRPGPPRGGRPRSPGTRRRRERGTQTGCARLAAAARLDPRHRAGSTRRPRATRRRTGWSPRRHADRARGRARRGAAGVLGVEPTRSRTPGRSARASCRGRTATGASPGSS